MESVRNKKNDGRTIDKIVFNYLVQFSEEVHQRIRTQSFFLSNHKNNPFHWANHYSNCPNTQWYYHNSSKCQTLIFYQRDTARYTWFAISIRIRPFHVSFLCRIHQCKVLESLWGLLCLWKVGGCQISLRRCSCMREWFGNCGLGWVLCLGVRFICIYSFFHRRPFCFRL